MDNIYTWTYMDNIYTWTDGHTVPLKTIPLSLFPSISDHLPLTPGPLRFPGTTSRSPDCSVWSRPPRWPYGRLQGKKNKPVRAQETPSNPTFRRPHHPSIFWRDSQFICTIPDDGFHEWSHSVCMTWFPHLHKTRLIFIKYWGCRANSLVIEIYESKWKIWTPPQYNKHSQRSAAIRW